MSAPTFPAAAFTRSPFRHRAPREAAQLPVTRIARAAAVHTLQYDKGAAYDGTLRKRRRTAPASR
jgi:hypothetical protein